ncbi:MAG TPA: response regulator [Blastocatellia bacterium]|nr:response regulator [Blastocatellia bacterium]
MESGNTIISGIEPVDELMGGLERGQLYLVHGEGPGKSLFGIKFLIEGFKHGENGALVIRYSPEDAVRRFARLGYDCLEDVYSGRLVILEYSDDIIQKIGKLREITPVLRELEWLLGETRPVRLIFDPVSSVLAGAEGNLDTRAREFASWARSFGATVVLVATESNHEIIRCFKPLVAESFRFSVTHVDERAAGFITFEKSSAIPDQRIEVDPARGVFLLGRALAAEGDHQTEPRPPSTAELDSIKEELRAARMPTEESEPLSEIEPNREASVSIDGLGQDDSARFGSDLEPPDIRQTRKLTPIEEIEFQAPRARVTSQPADAASKDEFELHLEELVGPSAPPPPLPPLDVAPDDELSYLLDDLVGSTSPLDLDLAEPKSNDTTADRATVAPPGGKQQGGRPSPADSAEGQPPITLVRETPSMGSDAEQANTRSTRHGRASDLSPDSTIAARAVELLLHPPESETAIEFPSGASKLARRTVGETQHLERPPEAELRPADFNVLIIEDDPETCDFVTQTLADYSLEVVQDGVSGLAKLISLKPDLVVLDFDLPVIDGFKVLTLIRSALNVPIIIMSGSRMRAIDRVMASELGADYYLTKPFSAKELKHKARQLIARYRGLSSWIINPSSATVSTRNERLPASASMGQELFTPYAQFAAEVDKRVKTAMDSDAPFSIVGCRLPMMSADGGPRALRLFEIVRGLARDSDITSTNPRNDLVILLADSGPQGARSFAARLRARVMDEWNVEPTLWVRSFPDIGESGAAAAANVSAQSGAFSRRSGDQANQQRGRARTALNDEQFANEAEPRN